MFPLGRIKFNVLLRNLLLLQQVFCSIYAIAQNGEQNWLKQNSYDRSVSVFDANGRAFTNRNWDIAGSAFFLDEWKYGSLKLNNNKEYGQLKLRLNLQNNEVHFISTNNVEMAVNKGLIKEITLSDSIKAATYTFQCGFPAIDQQDQNSFYLLLADGKIKFIKSIRKIISEDKDLISGEIKKEFITYEDYYFFFLNILQRIRKDRNYMLGIMGDKNDKIENFVKVNKLSYKSVDDIKKIVDYYNSISPN